MSMPKQIRIWDLRVSVNYFRVLEIGMAFGLVKLVYLCPSYQHTQGLYKFHEIAGRHQLHSISGHWARSWQMSFNISKCKVMHLGRRNVGFQYCMNGQLLEEVTSYEDLGIIMTSHLKVAEQCQEAYRKANRMLGLVKRTIHHHHHHISFIA